jgi:hypothetical protein
MVSPRHQVSLVVWAGVLLGPLGWVGSQAVSHVLASHLCGPSAFLPLLVIHAAGVALALAGALLCWWGSTRRDVQNATGPARNERRFLASIGVGSGLLFAIVTVAQGAAGFFFPGCTA